MNARLFSLSRHYTFENTVPIIEDYFTCAPKNISLFDHMLQLNSGDTNTTQRCIMNDTVRGDTSVGFIFIIYII